MIRKAEGMLFKNVPGQYIETVSAAGGVAGVALGVGGLAGRLGGIWPVSRRPDFHAPHASTGNP